MNKSRSIINRFPDGSVKKIRINGHDSYNEKSTEITYSQNGEKAVEEEFYYSAGQLEKSIRYKYKPRKALISKTFFNDNGYLIEEYMAIGEFDPSPTNDSIKDVIHISETFNKFGLRQGLRIAYEYKDSITKYAIKTGFHNRYDQYISVKTMYSNGKKHGLDISYSFPIELEKEIHFCFGNNSPYALRTGKERIIVKDDIDGNKYVLSYKNNYKNGVLNGESINCYGNTGSIRERGNYKNGIKVGKWYYYLKNKLGDTVVEYEDGIPKIKTIYYENGIKNFELKKPAEDHTDEIFSNYFLKLYQNIPIHYYRILCEPSFSGGSEMSYYNRDGNLLVKGDNKSTKYEFIDENASSSGIKIEKFIVPPIIKKNNIPASGFCDDYLNLESIQWDRELFYNFIAKRIMKSNENAILCASHYLFCVINRKDGIFHGKYLEWNYNQYLLIDGIYRYGKKHGIWKFYDIDGNIMLSVNYKDDDKCGTWKKYDNYGKILEERDYINDRKYFDKNYNINDQNDDENNQIKSLLPNL